MKRYLLFLLPLTFICGNVNSQLLLIPSSDSVNKTFPKSRISLYVHDSSNVVTGKRVGATLKVLMGKWELQMFNMIGKDGAIQKIEQTGTTIQFTPGYKMITEGLLSAECSWTFDSTTNIFTTRLEKINGSKAEQSVVQRNKIIYLSKDSLIYLYNDAVTQTTLEMHYRRL